MRVASALLATALASTLAACDSNNDDTGDETVDAGITTQCMSASMPRLVQLTVPAADGSRCTLGVT